MPQLGLSGTYKGFLLLQPGDIGFTLFFSRFDYIPTSASLFLNWRVRYSDGNVSPPGYHWINDLLDISNPNNAKGLNIKTEEHFNVLGSTQPRTVQLKGYMRRWAYYSVDFTQYGSLQNAIGNMPLFNVDGYVLNSSLLV